MVARVLIADDYGLTRAGVKMLLSDQPDLEVVGEASTGEEVVELAKTVRADVVIMDLQMPGLGGVEATRILVDEEFAESGELIKVLVLTAHRDDESVFDSLRAGASGFVVKDFAPEQLLKAVHALARGDSWVDPSVASQVLAALRRSPSKHHHVRSDLVQRLTKREREVLQLMATGLSNPEISDHLVLSEATVRTHVSRILMKTGSRDRTAAVVLAYQSHLVQPPRAF